LQTVSGLKLPIKIFVLNNTGYHSIRQTQRNFFPDNIVGCGEDSGLSFPNFEKVAAAFNLPFRRIQMHDELDDVIRRVLTSRGPVLCEVMLDLAQGFAPKLSSRKLEDGRMETAPLDDMAPFLSREELAENIIT
jgi:acetolactate synthase-1/2/3 large subunit